MNLVAADTWSTDWAWSLPLIVLNVIVHVFGRFIFKFASVIGLAVLLMVMLHGIEAVTWAAAYRMLGALPDNKSAMLYSLGAMTSYGHANLFLQVEWQMMGVLQSLNGVLLFGLSTAFLFAMVQSVWPGPKRETSATTE